MSKVDSTGTRTYLRDGAYVTDPVLSDGAAAYTPGISERRSSVTKFYHPDRLGTTERLTDTNQSTTDTRQYDAFGLLTSSSGSTPTPFGFAGAWGYQEDPDSGLKLLGHRYYDPSTGRFLTRDPIKDGRNWYGYCGNNSVGAVDSSGLYPWTGWGIETRVENHSGVHIVVVGDYFPPGVGPFGNWRKGAIIIPPGKVSPPRFDVDEVVVPGTGTWDPHNFPISPHVRMRVLPDETVITTTFGDWIEPSLGMGGEYAIARANPMSLSEFLEMFPPPPDPIPWGPPYVDDSPSAGMPKRLGRNPIWN